MGWAEVGWDPADPTVLMDGGPRSVSQSGPPARISSSWGFPVHLWVIPLSVSVAWVLGLPRADPWSPSHWVLAGSEYHLCGCVQRPVAEYHPCGFVFSDWLCSIIIVRPALLLFRECLNKFFVESS